MSEKYIKAFVALVLGGIAVAVPMLVGVIMFIASTIMAVMCLLDSEKGVRIIGGGTLAWDIVWLVLFCVYLGTL